MRATRGAILVVAFVVAASAGSVARANNSGRHPSRGRAGHAAAGRPHLTGNGAKVSVQPFGGPNAEPLRGAEPLRALIARIVRGRGFRAMTTLPHYEGTGQYPGLARDHHLAAFVTADLEERGNWQRITFLVWNGLTGSILGRWTTSAPAPVLARAVGRGFWQHLGPAMLKAEAPALPLELQQAAPIRIDASASNDSTSHAIRMEDERVATR
jgi:hypothetical protein